MLEILWYLVIGAAMLFYTVLDGFDLGVGALHLFTKERRVFLNAIGPVWDGNEVWIVIVMGGMFAGFPNVYATIFSGFYSLFMVLIAAFMFRAAAIEFRSKREASAWRNSWDAVFSLASVLVAFIFGLLMGNMIVGIPLNEAQDYVGTFFDFFHPYAVAVGVFAVSLFAMHGALYLMLKTEGKAYDAVKKLVLPSVCVFFALYAVVTLATWAYMPHMTRIFRISPLSALVPLVSLLALLNIPYQVKKGRPGWAFVSSCVGIALLLCLYGLGTYPQIVLSSLHPETNSLTIFNSASSPKTLSILLLIVAMGLPLVLTYGYWVYRIFRGKVRLDKSSY